ncbi:MAG: hypothetical protein AAB460_02545 [Patescibacteria group bacterium]
MDSIQDIRYTPPSQQPPRPTPPPPEQKKSHGLLWSLIILVILVLVGYWLLTMDKGILTDGAGNPLSVAPEGQVVEEFPSDLLIDPSPTITGSYTIYYRDRGETMPYVEYTSDETYEENIIAFRAMLLDDGWTITKEGDPALEVSNIYAIRGENDSETVNVTFSHMADGKTKVQISYTETK